MKNDTLDVVRHGLIMALAALIFGALWAAYMATHHEQLHSAFEAQESAIQSAQMDHVMEDLNMDAMQMDHAHEAGAAADHHQSHDAGAHATDAQHSHSGSLSKDAMQRLLRGHIHFMGIGVLAAVLLLITAFTSLKFCWKKVLGWTFGLGALAYPPAWILMGFRTVELGPQAAEASVMWLFGPAVGSLLASMAALFVVLFLEVIGMQHRMPVLKWFFSNK
jgi:hypothetical protein